MPAGAGVGTLSVLTAGYWVRVSRFGGLPTPQQSAMLSQCPRAQYCSRLHALTSFTQRVSPASIFVALVGLLAGREICGATVSALRNITSAVCIMEDLRWLQPAVSRLHQPIAMGTLASEMQEYLPRSGSCLLTK